MGGWAAGLRSIVFSHALKRLSDLPSLSHLQQPDPPPSRGCRASCVTQKRDTAPDSINRQLLHVSTGPHPASYSGTSLLQLTSFHLHREVPSPRGRFEHMK